MKKIIIGMLAYIACSAYAGELKTFPEALQAIQQGAIPNIVIDVKGCEADPQLGDSFATIRPDAIMIVGGNRITGTHRHFTLDQPLMKGVPLFINSKFTLNEMGEAGIKFTLMRAGDYTKVKEIDIKCEFGKGFKLFV